MPEFRLVYVFKYTATDNRILRIHKHDFYEIVYYYKGSGTATINDKYYKFGENTFTVIPPNNNHNDQYDEGGGEVYCVGFYTDQEIMPSLNSDYSGIFLNIIKQILKETTKQLFGYRYINSAKLTELFVELERSTRRSFSDKTFEYTRNYLSENYHSKVLLSDIAKQLNLSYGHFRQKFKEESGESPKSFLLNMRLRAANDLLLNSDYSCTEIAYHCGFSNSAQFSLQFKKKFGITPLQYKKRQT